LDLYYRLSVFIIQLPALRERKADIALLANFYLKEFAKKVNRPALNMNEKLLGLLEAHNWKGNVRELKNVIERLVILADHDVLNPDQLPNEFFVAAPKTNAYDLQTVEKQHIQKILMQTKGNKSETARLLNIGLTTLYRKIEEYKIV
jgi:two-component system NtrC family response regulator